jgi:hypothetical protein
MKLYLSVTFFVVSSVLMMPLLGFTSLHLNPYQQVVGILLLIVSLFGCIICLLKLRNHIRWSAAELNFKVATEISPKYKLKPRQTSFAPPAGLHLVSKNKDELIMDINFSFRGLSSLKQQTSDLLQPLFYSS